jgi:hypothetical protein
VLKGGDEGELQRLAPLVALFGRRRPVRDDKVLAMAVLDPGRWRSSHGDTKLEALERLAALVFGGP